MEGYRRVGRSTVLVLRCCIGKLGESEMLTVAYCTWGCGWLAGRSNPIEGCSLQVIYLRPHISSWGKKISKVHVYDWCARLEKGRYFT